MWLVLPAVSVLVRLTAPAADPVSNPVLMLPPSVMAPPELSVSALGAARAPSIPMEAADRKVVSPVMVPVVATPRLPASAMLTEPASLT